MPGAGERAYAYAKACGIIGKSFVGKRAGNLSRAARLSELDRLVFPVSSRDLPEKELLSDLEGRLIKRAADSIIAVVDSFRKPPELFSLLIRSYEYADLKSALTAAAGGTAKPAFTGIGRFGTVRFSAWPDIPAMIRGTEFEFLLNKNGELDKENSGITLQTELDRRYYRALWKALRRLSARDRRASEFILSEEIALKNAVWALRLRTYYEMKADAIRSHLIDIAVPMKGRQVSLAADAFACLELPLDSRQAWKGWRRESFLNPGLGEWRADPRYFQNAAAQYLYRLARRSFRADPFSLDTVFCFIKIKQFEEDVLTSSAEGLGLGMTSRDVFAMLGVES
ncbi:MAG: V-type ATPase subunit [Treponema sp.]|jgi:vacuolar-type H+-ATPase subunit C/Vma6|nr:V-type ATPase subunit [Treponema sp.]